MALNKTRVKEILSAAGVPVENLESAATEIMGGHITSIDALREERDGYKAEVERLQGVQKELDDLRASHSDDFKDRYEKEHAALEALKLQHAKEASDREKAEQYGKRVLKKAGIDPKRWDAIIRLTDLDKLELRDGSFNNEDGLVSTAQSEWADFVVTESVRGASPDTPPHVVDPNAFEQMSLTDKMKFANEHPNDPSVQNWLKKE